MSTLSDIEKSVAEITTNGFNDIVLIHCVSTYPSRLRDMNLRFIELLHSTFGFPVGLSDHTESSIAACMALCTGVSYIEKHITMDRSQEGFDHAYACEGDAFIRYVQDIRDAEAALRTPAEKISHSEHTVRERARRGLYAARDMHTGETVTDPDILVLRPQSVMAADQITDIVGKILAMPVRRFEPFNPGQFAQHGQ
jgi:sialic acid synthase SpsE